MKLWNSVMFKLVRKNNIVYLTLFTGSQHNGWKRSGINFPFAACSSLQAWYGKFDLFDWLKLFSNEWFNWMIWLSDSIEWLDWMIRLNESIKRFNWMIQFNDLLNDPIVWLV